MLKTDPKSRPLAQFPEQACSVCTKGKGVCNGEVMVYSTESALELFMRCAPIDLSGSARAQAEKFYGCLPDVLDHHGASMGDVVLERVFFRDISRDYETFGEVRQAAYSAAGVTGAQLPASSYIEQPPCRPWQAFELQLYAVVPRHDDVKVHSFEPTSHNAMAKIVEMSGLRHLYVTNINGLTDEGGRLQDFMTQSDQMFARGEELLLQHGGEFSKVLRTWCYLDDIDRDYADFNVSRNAFFRRENIERLPASTGIRAGLYPPAARCAFDLYALLDPSAARIEVMHTPTLNEAPEYGSAFSRGIKLSLPEKTVLFISGTASVDECGETVHLNDHRRQIERMLLNVEQLLKPSGGSFGDMAQVITYLKDANDLELFLEIWDDWGLSELPNTFVEAGVCRPELLCEMETIAILPAEDVGIGGSKPD